MNERKNLESFGEKIIGELFDTLMNIDLINSWKEKFILPIYNSTYIDPFEYISMKRKEYILETKKISSLYYLGEFNLSENFKSYLIKRRTFYEPIYVHSIVYLINVIDGAICSIVPVNSVFTPDYFYCTKQIEKNLFVYGSLDFQGKVKNRKMTYWNNSTLFYFDEKGFLRIM